MRQVGDFFVPVFQGDINIYSYLHGLLSICFLIYLISAPNFVSAAGSTDSGLRPDKYAVATQNIAESIFKKIIARSKNESKFKSLDSFKKAVESAESTVEANGLIISNNQILDDYIDDIGTLLFLKHLLDGNLYWAADKLLNKIDKEGDRGLSAQAYYYMGEYLFKRQEWKRAYHLLSIGNEHRAAPQAAHANLMLGIIQQQLKNHRMAIPFYESIPRKSNYYKYAQLNMAIAYFRQDWWADSYRKLNETLGSIEIKKGDEFVNRLYLVLAYSMLLNDHNRYAKENFMKIETNSRFSKKGMSGLGLSALGLNEFRYAADVFAILKEDPYKSIVNDEAYLLYAYALEKMNNNKEALVGYKKAISYYQSRSTLLDEIVSPHSDFYSKVLFSLKHNKNILIIDDVEFDISNLASSYTVQDYRMLVELRTHISSIESAKSLIKPLDNLISEHERLLKEQVRDVVNVRKDTLASYENQTLYAMARLLDRRAKK